MKQNIPNILTSSRIVLTFVFLALYLSNSLEYRLIGIVIFGIAALTDFFDGYFARAYKVSSPLGVFLDPLADKFLTISGFVTLVLVFPKWFPWWAILLILFRDIFLTGFRMWAERDGAALVTRNSAKLKTVFQMVFLFLALISGAFRKLDTPLFDLSNWFFTSYALTYLLYFVTFLTVYTGLEYLYINRNRFLKP